MKKILVPVDFSSHTHLTCEYALSLLRNTGGEIRLFNAYIDQVILTENSYPEAIDVAAHVNEELMKEIIFQAKTGLHDLQHHLEQQIAEQQSRIIVTKFLAGGTIRDEVRSVCHEFQPDAVVMGSRGKGGKLSTWGNVSSYIIQHARIPVLTVPPIEGFMGFKNIMFAADLTEWNTASLKVVRDWFSPFGARIHCVHFLIHGNHKEEEEKMQQLQSAFFMEKQSGEMTFSMIEVDDDNQKAIDHFVEEHAIQLIAFQPYQRNFLYRTFTRNITQWHLFATNIPLLAVPVG